MVDRIRELCARERITLVSLEASLSFAKNSIYKWDTHKPSVDKIQKVADYFGVSVDYLLGRETPNAGLLLTPDEQAAVEAFLAVYRANKEK